MSLMKDKLYPKTETVSIGYSGFPASKLQVNSEKDSNVRDQHGLLGFRKWKLKVGIPSLGSFTQKM